MQMKDLKVIDSLRTNELSTVPGGSVVTVVHKDGKRLVYDKIKKPYSYVNTILKNPSVSEIFLDGEKIYPQ
jgi:hypothetical protein